LSSKSLLSSLTHVAVSSCEGRWMIKESNRLSSHAPNAPQQRRTVKVIIDRCEIFRSFTSVGSRMDPYVEVDIGRCLDYDHVNWRWVATTPKAVQGNQRPVWNFQLDAQEFLEDEDLRVSVLIKNILGKDVLVGIGHLKLTKALMDKRASAEDVKLFKRRAKGQEEHTGNLEVHVNFPPLKARGFSDGDSVKSRRSSCSAPMAPMTSSLSAGSALNVAPKEEYSTWMANQKVPKLRPKVQVGATATLDNIGYKQVLVLRDVSEMVIFLSRVCKLITPVSMEGPLTKRAWKWMQDDAAAPVDFAALVQEVRVLCNAAESLAGGKTGTPSWPQRWAGSYADDEEASQFETARPTTCGAALGLPIQSRQGKGVDQQLVEEWLQRASLPSCATNDSCKEQVPCLDSLVPPRFKYGRATDLPCESAPPAAFRPDIRTALPKPVDHDRGDLAKLHEWGRQLCSNWCAPTACSEGLRRLLAERFEQWFLRSQAASSPDHPLDARFVAHR